MNRSGARALMAITVVVSLFALLIGLWAFDHIPTLVLVPYGLFSLVAFAMYGLDKAASRQRAQRISENALHLVGLIGGWPGALVARHLFRHKTRKQPFRQVFWVTVVANCAALTWLVYAAPFGQR
ncbi:uncharacterized membrane protein YsdA (DUF1294 family) [Nocardioides daedukensis]|uniref:Uncharacterized membrane protein YsdA (DUF1294 family) n=1 Tax=Nocardioides daedukensis TaxID=634462 RepID=A0A7Y9UVG9_9ACTN|nr:DUF1294 domain-containing protein [Nocardioides daedukensis]NYG57135.1 uncharacterized membrane protein YsdA (DUF1294 family) [Nocardioides daedukensis]